MGGRDHANFCMCFMHNQCVVIIMTPREAAAKIICKSVKENAFTNIEYANILREHEFSDGDRALLKIIINGTLQNIKFIDGILKKYIKVNYNKQKPLVKAILQTAVFQLLFTDRIPDSAICNEAVKITKKVVSPGISGFVNGVLRSIVRDKKELLKKKNETDLSSLPDWLVGIFTESYGKKSSDEICKAMDIPMKTAIVLNTVKFTTDEINRMLEVDHIEIDDDNFLVTGTDLINKSSFKNGAFFIQGHSSQLIALILKPKQDEIILDCCAAPGGKSFNLLVASKGKAKIHALDISQKRVEMINDGIKRLSLDNIITEAADASMPLNFNEEYFDKILCDVPCTGYGSIRKKRDIIFRDMDNYKALTEIQYNILTNTSHYLKKGGYILYSTCTLNRHENEEIVEKFVQDNRNFEFITLNEVLFERTSCIFDKKYVTILPCEKYDGFFVSLIRKKGMDKGHG